MARHLLAIGVRPKGISPSVRAMDEVDRAVARLGELVTARCRNARDLVELVSHHGAGQGRVETLDIYDHGKPGKQRLGTEIVLESDDDRCAPLKGAKLLRELAPHLSPNAQVRLLGCLTVGPHFRRGRLLLIKAARELGARRIVFGTLDTIEPYHFNRDGFIPAVEKSFLFSSLAALDGNAPDRKQRRANIKDVSERCDS